MKNRHNNFALLLSVFICLHIGLAVGAPSDLKPVQDAQTQPSFTAKRLAEIDANVSNIIQDLSPADNSQCLIYSFSFHWFYIRIITYEDTGWRSCDVSQYEKLTPNSVITQMRTLPNKPYYVMLPGVHFGTMDVIKSGLDASFISIGSINFYPIAVSEYNLFELMRDGLLFGRGGSLAYGKSYSSIKTRENLYVRWNPGNEVMYLKSPDNKYYVMTSYTSALIPKLNRGNLRDLGKYMNLPEGWSFSSKVLQKVLELQTKQGDGFKTSRLLDEYNNVYLEMDASKFMH